MRIEEPHKVMHIETVLVITSLTCDRCGEEMRPRGEEHFDEVPGHFSIHQELERRALWEAELCDTCAHAVRKFIDAGKGRGCLLRITSKPIEASSSDAEYATNGLRRVKEAELREVSR